MIKVKTFTNELKIFQTHKELISLDQQVNDFIKENAIKKVFSMSDCATTDDTGATIGIIRALTYEDPARGRSK